MKVYYLFLLIIPIHFSFAIHSSISSMPTAGTDTRVEKEFKLAFAISKDRSLSDIKKAVMSELKSILPTLKFGTHLDEEFTISREFQPFVFKDIYLDTPSFDLLDARSAYRLRYRWTRLDYYLRHQLFPFLKSFYPSRCEIQFKGNYQWKGNIVRAEETRFEFRNESHPFFELQNAPPAPWPQDIYLNYAQRGIYQQYAMKPAIALMKQLPQLKEAVVEPIVEVLTIRERLHLQVPNPWGMGPNPNQVFIVTLDRSDILPRKSNATRIQEGKVLLEIEVEPDRSTLEGIQRVLWLERIPKLKTLNQTLIPFTKTAKISLFQDLDTLRKRLDQRMRLTLQHPPLRRNYKYARSHQFLNFSSLP